MTINNFIKRDFLITTPFTGISSIRNELLQNSGMVVLEDEKFFGILTKDDLINRPRNLVIDSITPKTVLDTDSTVSYALQVMRHENSDVLPVLKDNKIYGLVYKNDLIDFFASKNQTIDKEFQEIIQKQRLELDHLVEKRTRELILLVETKEKFIRIIAHELRSPFTSILGFLDLLKENLHKYDIDTIEKFISHIHYSAISTFDLLVNLLSWLNAKNKKVAFDAVEINIDEIFIEDILVSSRFAAEQKNITVELIIPPNLNVLVDTNMLKVIFRNLVNNAIKYTNSGGRISVCATELENFIEITVKDSGIGLSEERLEQMFKIEGITSALGTANEPGTGLGLLLCKEFVEIEGGQIWVESVIGTGSEFKFTLPKVIVSVENHKAGN
jgi:signal transduction histidine kinase